MEDAAPGLYASLKRGYERNIEANRRIGNLEEKLEDGGTYQVAEEYSYEIGEALSKAFADGLSSEVLPDGHMYYNIAVRTVDPLIREAWGEAAAAAVKAQENINGAAGLRIRAKQAEFNEDRLHQLINVLTQDGVPYDEVSGILERKTTNVIQSAVDDTLKTNADFQARAGLSPKIVRIADPKCCEWCQSLEGEYPYPAPKEIYQRHANCECVVDFHAANGRVQNIHTREWRDEQRAAEVEERKRREQEREEAERAEEYNNETSFAIKRNETTDWGGIPKDVSRGDIDSLKELAAENGIVLDQSFVSFDGDINLVRDFINQVGDNISERSFMRNKDIRLGVRYSMNDTTYAETEGSTIYINGFAFRDRELLAEDYQKKVNEGWFTQGSDYLDIATHESGHLLVYMNQLKTGGINESVFGRNAVDAFNLTKEHISEYAAENENELIAESYVAYKNGSNDEYVLNVLKYCGILK